MKSTPKPSPCNNRRGSAALLACVLIAACGARAAQTAPAGADNSRCLQCHGNDLIATQSPEERQLLVVMPESAAPPAPGPETRPGLFVKVNELAAGPHAKLACVDCHPKGKTLPHPRTQGPATCNGGCHAKAGAEHARGPHAAAAAKGAADAPTCAACHGGHDILARTDARSRTHRGTVSRTCGDCHAKLKALRPGRPDGKARVAEYAASVHAEVPRGAQGPGATCADCHGNHEALPAGDSASPVHWSRLGGTCGRCHEREARVYGGTIHGQYNTLGASGPARCNSCHEDHGIRRIADPAGSLAPANRLTTCRRCHFGAGPMLTQFQPHADPRDAARFPLLHAIRRDFLIAMSVVFGFFGLHALLWLCRSLVERLRQGPRPRRPAETHAILRFGRDHRVNHFLTIVSFFGLTLTGLPLLYSQQAWGRALAGMLGGPSTTGLLHRVFAGVLIAVFANHLGGLVRLARKDGPRRLLFGPASLLPRWKDVTDCLAMFRWFLGGGPRPTMGQWAYWEKFDYFAALAGSVIIGTTGLLLWFPEAFSHLVPGWMFNVAALVHGYEALLAIGFLFTIHFYNTHLRPGRFPVDDVIFTGRLGEEQFRQERGAEYERLRAGGELDKLRVPPPGWGYRVLAVVVGVLAVTVGLALVVLIVLAGLGVI